MINYITTLSFEKNHINHVFDRSKFKNLFNIVDYEKIDNHDFDREDIYLLNCLGSSEMAKFFIKLKDEGKIEKLVLYNSGNVDFLPLSILNRFDLIFYETLYTYERSYLDQHKNCFRAFGINTDIFKNINLEKKFDYILVGSINDYLKRFTLMTQSVDKESKILMIGDIYTEEDSRKIDNLLDEGYNIEIKNRCSLRELSYYYNMSKCVLLTQPEYGGGERCLLEAKYCGLDIEILDNIKLSELNEEKIVFDIDYFTSQIDKGLDSIF